MFQMNLKEGDNKLEVGLPQESTAIFFNNDSTHKNHNDPAYTCVSSTLEPPKHLQLYSQLDEPSQQQACCRDDIVFLFLLSEVEDRQWDIGCCENEIYELGEYMCHMQSRIDGKDSQSSYIPGYSSYKYLNGLEELKIIKGAIRRQDLGYLNLKNTLRTQISQEEGKLQDLWMKLKALTSQASRTSTSKGRTPLTTRNNNKGSHRERII